LPRRSPVGCTPPGVGNVSAETPSVYQQQADALALLAETILHHGLGPGAQRVLLPGGMPTTRRTSFVRPMVSHQSPNGRYQPRPKAVGSIPWFDSLGSTYMVFWPFVEGLAATA
jgi:hypothetical protein